MRAGNFPTKTDVRTDITFKPVKTKAIRISKMVGPAHQPAFVRVNEILVRGIPSNIAPFAKATASSTFCGYDCYSALKVNDDEINTALGPQNSWTNNDVSQPQWLQLQWARPIKTSSIDVYSTAGYALRGFDVEYYSDGAWLPVQSRVSSTVGA